MRRRLRDVGVENRDVGVVVQSSTFRYLFRNLAQGYCHQLRVALQSTPCLNLKKLVGAVPRALIRSADLRRHEN